MTSASKTASSRKAKRRDRLARWVITLGGVMVIASVAAILAMIAGVTVPVVPPAAGRGGLHLPLARRHPRQGRLGAGDRNGLWRNETPRPWCGPPTARWRHRPPHRPVTRRRCLSAPRLQGDSPIFAAKRPVHIATSVAPRKSGQSPHASCTSSRWRRASIPCCGPMAARRWSRSLPPVAAQGPQYAVRILASIPCGAGVPPAHAPGTPAPHPVRAGGTPAPQVPLQALVRRSDAGAVTARRVVAQQRDFDPPPDDRREPGRRRRSDHARHRPAGPRCRRHPRDDDGPRGQHALRRHGRRAAGPLAIGPAGRGRRPRSSPRLCRPAGRHLAGLVAGRRFAGRRRRPGRPDDLVHRQRRRHPQAADDPPTQPASGRGPRDPALRPQQDARQPRRRRRRASGLHDQRAAAALHRAAGRPAAASSGARPARRRPGGPRRRRHAAASGGSPAAARKSVGIPSSERCFTRATSRRSTPGRPPAARISSRSSVSCRWCSAR